MNALDVLLLFAAVWFAVVGYKQGFVVGMLSVVGFVGGGLGALGGGPVVDVRDTSCGPLERPMERALQVQCDARSGPLPVPGLDPPRNDLPV